jgi:hypothetical protein
MRERDYFEYHGVNARIILKLIFRKWEVGAWSGLIWLRIGSVGWHLYDIEASGSIKCREFLNLLGTG